MKNENDKKIDNLFKEGLENPDDQFGYREEDWNDLEDMLNQHKKKRGIVYLLPILSGVAALMLLFLGWWLFQSKITQPKSQVVKVVPQKVNSNTAEDDRQIQSLRKVVQQKINNLATTIKNTPTVSQTPVYDNSSDSIISKKTSTIALSNPVNKSKNSAFDSSFVKNHPIYKGSLFNPATINDLKKSDQFAGLNNTGSPVIIRPNIPSIINNNNIVRNNAAPALSPHAELGLPLKTNENAGQKIPIGNGKVPEQPVATVEKPKQSSVATADKPNAGLMKMLENTSSPINKLNAKT